MDPFGSTCVVVSQPGASAPTVGRAAVAVSWPVGRAGTMAAMSERPSGWYPDPDDDSVLRYWDGILWTERTMPRIKPGLEQSHISDAPAVKSVAEREREQQEHAQRHHHRPELHRHPQGSGHQDPYRSPQGAPQGPRSQMHQGPQGPVDTTGLRLTPDGQLLAAWWRRALAYLIDTWITFMIAVPISWPWISGWVAGFRRWWDDAFAAAQAGAAQPAVPDALYQAPWQLAAISAVTFLVYDTVLTAFGGRTLGRMALGIKVRGEESSDAPKLGDAAYRTAIKNVSSFTSTVPVLGFVTLVFQVVDYFRPISHPTRQSFHDSWSKTYVVQTRGLLARRIEAQRGAGPR